MATESPLRDELVGLLPDLRAFARSLERDRARADDLVQETFVRALAALDRFQPGTNMGAWAFTILRHAFYTQHRKTRRAATVSIDDEAHPAPSIDAPQESHLVMRDVRQAFWKLSPEHREALVLVTMRGLTYMEAASICGCAIGTMKARVSRARKQLQSLIDPNPAGAASTLP